MCRSTLRISTGMEELRDISVQQTARMYCSLRALVEREVLTVNTFSNILFKTRLSASTIFASGESNSTDHVHGTFDQLFPNIHDHLGVSPTCRWRITRSA